MKMSSLSGNGAHKFLLLLLTSLSHYYSGLVTCVEPAKGICADIAANKSVDFLLVGANSINRLLITAKPDFLVYEFHWLPDDTANIYGMRPGWFDDDFTVLFENSNISQLLKSESSSDVKAFTVAIEEDQKMVMYLKIFFPRLKLLFSYNMDRPNVDVITYNPPILDTQQFVSIFTDDYSFENYVYSFVNLPQEGPRRMWYDLSIAFPDMTLARSDTTCKVEYEPSTMVLRSGRLNCHDCNRFYNDWNWTESPRGWADVGQHIPDVRFYLFDRHQQQVYIFDQNDNELGRNDVFSVVYQKSYKDFFRCTSAPTTSTKSSTATKVSKQTTTVPSTSSQPVNSTTSSSPNESSSTPVSTSSSVTTDADTSRTTFSEKPKFPLWISILIVVILVVILIVAAFFVGYLLGSGNKYSDAKVASSAKLGNSNQLAVDGIGPTGSQLNANSNSSASKASIRGSVVAPSKGPGSKAKK